MYAAADSYMARSRQYLMEGTACPDEAQPVFDTAFCPVLAHRPPAVPPAGQPGSSSCPHACLAAHTTAAALQ